MEKDNHDALPNQSVGTPDVPQDVQESKSEPKIETSKEDGPPAKAEPKIETVKADGPPPPPPPVNIESKIKIAKEDGPPTKVVNPLRLARPLEAAKRSTSIAFRPSPTHPMPLPTISPLCPPGSAGKSAPMPPTPAPNPTPTTLCSETNNSTPTTSKVISQPSKLPPPIEPKSQLVCKVAAPPPVMQPLKANVPPTEACNAEQVPQMKPKDLQTPTPVTAQSSPIKDATAPPKKKEMKDEALENPKADIAQSSPIKDAPTLKKEQIKEKAMETAVTNNEQVSPIKNGPSPPIKDAPTTSKKEQIKNKPVESKAADIAQDSPIKDEPKIPKPVDKPLDKTTEATAVPESNKRKRKREINPPPPVPDKENRTSKRSRAKVSSYQDDLELEQAMRAIQKQDLEEKRSKALGSQETKVLENNFKTSKNNSTTSKNGEDIDASISSKNGEDIDASISSKNATVEKETKNAEEDKISLNDEDDVPIAKRRGVKKKKEKSSEKIEKELVQKVKPTREKKKKKTLPKKVIHSDNADPVFFKKEYLAVRNIDGGFFLCTAAQNIYPGDHNIQIMWLSNEFPVTQIKNEGIYCADFKDKIEFETILSSVEMETEKVKGNKKLRHKLDSTERERIGHILQRAIDKAEGKLDESTLQLTEDNPDGLDISLYTGEDQLDKIEERRSKGEKSKNTPKLTETIKSPKKSKKPSKIAKATSDLKLKITTVKKKRTSDLNSSEDAPPKKEAKVDEFDFNEDSEEEVVPVPKKRSMLAKQD